MKIPMIPMLRILKQYAAAKNLPLKATSFESIIRTFQHYCQSCKKLN